MKRRGGALLAEMFTSLCSSFFIWTMGRERSQRSRQLLIFAGSYQRGRERERSRERGRGRSSTPTLLIKKSLSAPCSLNKKAGRTVEQNTHARQTLSSLIFCFVFLPISYSNQTTAFGDATVFCFTTFDFALCKGSHNISLYDA